MTELFLLVEPIHLDDDPVGVEVETVAFLLPPIRPPQQAPAAPPDERQPIDATDALTREHTDHYAAEAAEEFLGDEPRDEASPPSGDNR